MPAPAALCYHLVRLVVRLDVRPDVSPVPTSPAMVALGKHAVRSWTSPFPCKKWNNPQCGQVHYTDAATGASYDRRRSSAL